MALFRFSDPMSGLLALQEELDRAFRNPSWLDIGPSGRGVFPPVNVFSDKQGYVIRFEVPGVAPGKISIGTNDRTLTVSGTREVAGREKGSFHRRERESGQFSRSLRLPEDLDFSAAKASCKNGILTLQIPKREETKPRQISVQVG